MTEDEFESLADGSWKFEIESLRQQLDWVRNILASHGYDGPLGDGCCPLSEWLSERDDLGESLAQVKVKNEVLIQQLANSQKQVTLLRDEVIRCRDWFETQAKVMVILSGVSAVMGWSK